MVQQRAARAGRITEDDLGQHDAMIPASTRAATRQTSQGQYAVEDGNTWGPCANGWARRSGRRRCGRRWRVLLVLAEYVDADMLDSEIAGQLEAPQADAEGDDRGLGGDRAERGGGEAHGTRAALRRDHGDTGRVCRNTERRRSGEAGCASGEASRKVSRSGVWPSSESSFCEW